MLQMVGRGMGLTLRGREHESRRVMDRRVLQASRPGKYSRNCQIFTNKEPVFDSLCSSFF